VVGAALAGAGVAFQALLRNALADPFILGVSGGAVLGAAGVALFAGALASLLMPWGAFGGALAVALGIYVLGRRSIGTGGTGLLLIGVVVNAILSSWILLLTFLVPPDERLRIVAWLTGNLGAVYVGAPVLAAAAACTFAAWGAFQWVARDLNLLAMGDAVAASLGVPVARVRRWLFFTGSLATGVAVALSGLVGFVGLIVPHLLRLVSGPDHRLLVPTSMLAGASLLVLADAAARTVLAPADLPVGVVTALIGGPFFLWLLLRRRRPVLEGEE
jgi:iron complex transport system permease protein